MAAADRFDFLTLEQAAAVAEFDDNADAVRELIVTAQRGHGFLHLVQRLRDEREEQIAKQPIIDKLVAAGVKIIEGPRWADPAKSLTQLGTADDPLTPGAHASCPGHVAWIGEAWIEVPDQERSDGSDGEDDGYEPGFTAIYGCSDPVEYGHVDVSTTPARSAHNSRQVSEEEASAERRRVLANNKAWRAAETVRREWLKTLVSRKTVPKRSLRYILMELAIGGYQLHDAMQKRHGFACELLGISTATLTTTLSEASDARSQMITLALVLSAHENDLGVHTWRIPTGAADRYLSQITEWGYELSEIEQSVIKSNDDGE
jgi:ParB family chromosome partitioning protein